MKFSKKTAHRLIVSLSMFAPVLYLFGVMIFGLNGAYGFETNASYEIEESIEVKQISPLRSSDYEGLGTGDPNNFYFLWPSVVPSTDFEEHYYWFSGRLNVDTGSITRYRIRFPYLSYLWSTAEDGYTFSDFSMVSPSQNGMTFQILTTAPYSVYFDSLQVVDLTYTLPDMTNEQRRDFANAHFGNELFPQGISKFSYSVIREGTTIESYSSSLFPRDNFLVRVGANALSSEPLGFAPFGAFLSYLDQNMLHASSSQLALMIYGEVYWALHIVLADLVYHVAVFFPNLIERVFDWFGQKGLNDE